MRHLFFRDLAGPRVGLLVFDRRLQFGDVAVLGVLEHLDRHRRPDVRKMALDRDVDDFFEIINPLAWVCH